MGYLHESSLAITVFWLLLYIYSMLGAIDFGSSFWSMYYLKNQTSAGDLANRFLSPTWEVTNTILVFMVVAMVGLFPEAAFTLGTMLLIPVSLILLLITIRSTFMVFAYSLEGMRKPLRIVAGITGILVPTLLISALPITEGGLVEVINGVPTLLISKWLTSPAVYLYMLFGLTSSLFLSATFLADYSYQSEDPKAYAAYRKNALIIGPLCLISAMLVLVFLEPEARWLYNKLLFYLPWFMGSLGAFLLAYFAFFLPNQKDRFHPGRPRFAVLLVALQYFLATFAYGNAHYPYLVYPILTVDQAFTNINIFYNLIITILIGLAILLPLFFVFWRFFLKDKQYLARR